MASSQRYGIAPTGSGRTIAVAVFATVSGLAALFAYHTSPGQAEAVIDEAAAEPAAGGAAPAPAAGAAAGTASGQQAKAGSGAVTTSYLGRRVETVWGDVQVKITVRNGKVVSATAPMSPRSSQRSLSINKYAVPTLNKATVRAGSAKIDSVSGATVTSGGYVKSLQSALDEAHL